MHIHNNNIIKSTTMRLFGLLGIPIISRNSLSPLAFVSFLLSTNNIINNNSSSNTMSMMSRTIARVVKPKVNGPTIRLIGTVDIDGGGTPHELAHVDPFILLDAATIPHHNKPPFGAHPHRGHSVVTILLQGKIQSWDSFSDKHRIMAAPASYWVDAASGVFHDEVSVVEDESDPTQHMKLFQLWVGVAEADRHQPAKVQYDTNLPTYECVSEDGKEVGKGVHHVGPATTLITPHPITVRHITQQAGTTYKVNIPPHFGGFVIAMRGNATYGGTHATEDNAVMVLTNPADNDSNDDVPAYLEVTTQANAEAEYLVCAGERIQEPWFKKLVANGAIITATPEEARAMAPTVEEMTKAGKAEGGSFAPFGA